MDELNSQNQDKQFKEQVSTLEDAFRSTTEASTSFTNALTRFRDVVKKSLTGLHKGGIISIDG